MPDSSVCSGFGRRKCLFRKGLFWKRLLRPAVCLFLAAALFLSSASALSWPARGVVNTKDVRLRESADTQSTSLKKLKSGTALTVTGEETDAKGNRWYAVSLSDGTRGYVMSEYVSVADNEKISAARASGEAAVMLVRVSARCSRYNGLGKTWTRYHEVNGLKLEDGPLPVVLAPDVPFSLYTHLKSKTKAIGEDEEIYTPTVEEVAGGFTVTRSVTAATAKKEAVWEITFTFTPAGAVPSP